jgi:hypothetical protein
MCSAASLFTRKADPEGQILVACRDQLHRPVARLYASECWTIVLCGSDVRLLRECFRRATLERYSREHFLETAPQGYVGWSRKVGKQRPLGQRSISNRTASPIVGSWMPTRRA